MERIVVVHPRWGVFVGEDAEGVYFSKVYAAGQPCVATFADEAEAREFMTLSPEFEGASLVRVMPDYPDKYSGPMALLAAGIPPEHMGELLSDVIETEQQAELARAA